MNILVWLIIGGILGWLASKVMNTDDQQGMILNIVVGIAGALVGGWLLSPLFGAGTINQNDFSLAALLVSFLGAILLLAAYNLAKRGALR
ncbi:MAG TPA: GlsB/YeaQ/YmgE family stress response membrane protein [Candidatus Sulfomarinibacteraceae bacterium]|nr:GlsB/YeaQ/YmgE family stress response membrane protein [Candidatus Sulfomarinibacteraceae bacterium]